MLMTPLTDAIIISSGSEGEASQTTQLSAQSSRTKVSVICARSISSSCEVMIFKHCW
jgi:hypothetical protein